MSKNMIFMAGDSPVRCYFFIGNYFAPYNEIFLMDCFNDIEYIYF